MDAVTAVRRIRRKYRRPELTVRAMAKQMGITHATLHTVLTDGTASPDVTDKLTVWLRNKWPGLKSRIDDA